MTKIQIEDASRINRFMSFQEDITWRLRHLPSCWDNRAVQETIEVECEKKRKKKNQNSSKLLSLLPYKRELSSFLTIANRL